VPSTQDLFDEFTIRIYEPPLNARRYDGRVAQLDDPVSVLMLIIDFDTEVLMNGITNFIGNSSGRYAEQTVEALRKIGCTDASDRLRRILQLAEDAGMTHDAIQEDRGRVAEEEGNPTFAIRSFVQTHGDKWNDVDDAIEDIASGIDHDGLRAEGERYLARHLSVFEPALTEARGGLWRRLARFLRGRGW